MSTNFRDLETVGVFDVSRETLDKLGSYADLLRRWSRRINLVSSNTLDSIWTRHIADSAQLLSVIPHGAKTWVDIGSGAGFPGLVIAILRPDLSVTLIESDQRKSAFLRAAARETGSSAVVLTERIEAVEPQNADIVSARALAPLNRLLHLAERHLKPGGEAIFLKGRQFEPEIQEALETWRFDCETYPSRTEPGAVILTLTEIARA